MYSLARNAAAAYARVDVESQVVGADSHGLILMLYDGAIRAITLAETALAANNVQTKCIQIGRAIRIIEEGLLASLDTTQGGELAASLNDLYRYMTGRLIAANSRNDAAALAEVRGLLGELRGAWTAIRENKVTPAGGTMPHAGSAARTAPTRVK